MCPTPRDGSTFLLHDRFAVWLLPFVTGRIAEAEDDAYRAADGVVPPDEDDLLIPLIRVKRVLEVLRAPTDRHVDWKYQLDNLRSFESLGRR